MDDELYYSYINTFSSREGVKKVVRSLIDAANLLSKFSTVYVSQDAISSDFYVSTLHTVDERNSQFKTTKMQSTDTTLISTMEASRRQSTSSMRIYSPFLDEYVQ